MDPIDHAGYALRQEPEDPMYHFLVRRLLSMLLTLLVISILSFLLLKLQRGSYLDVELQRLRQTGASLPNTSADALLARYGVYDSVVGQYAIWITGIARGDFGYSFEFGVPVRSLVGGRLAASFLLSGSALLFSWLVAIPLGVFSATHRYSAPDYVITLLQFVGMAIPEFVIALVLMVVAWRYFGLDVGGFISERYADAPWSVPKLVDFLEHIWIPIVVISASNTAWLTRVMRANLLDVFTAQYVQTARAKGQQEGVVIWKHAVRNALHPVIMSAGSSLPSLISGEFIVSIVLNLPTIGPLYTGALIHQDTYLALTLLMFSAMLLVVGNLLADLALVWLDPRIRHP